MQRARTQSRRVAALSSWLRSRATVVLMLAVLQALLSYLPAVPSASAATELSARRTDWTDHATLRGYPAHAVAGEDAPGLPDVQTDWMIAPGAPLPELPGGEPAGLGLTDGETLPESWNPADTDEDGTETSGERGETDADADADGRVPLRELTVVRLLRGARMWSVRLAELSPAPPACSAPARSVTRTPVRVASRSTFPLPLPRLLI